MNQFQFNTQTRYCHLDFCGKVQASIPLTMEANRRVAAAAKKMGQAVNEASQLPQERQEGECYEAVMTCIDEMLGEGKADKIADCYPEEGESHFGLLEALEVLNYIKDGYNRAFTARFAAASGNAQRGNGGKAEHSPAKRPTPKKHKPRA